MPAAFTLPRLRGLARIVLAFAAALAIAVPASAQYTEGKEYLRYKQPFPVETGRKIEVIEFFSYGCPHCADLEPYMQAWIKRLPPDVQFRRIPVAFQPAWENLGRVYYTLEALGEEAKLSPEVFAAIHGNARINLAQEQKFFDWAASKGLDRKKVEDTYKSFGVAGKIGRAKQTAQTYNIQSVPTLIVDGKFLVSSSTAGTHERVPGALDAAIAVARAERPK
jgi:thiol:disulfide interchange protein DsbA